MLIFRKGYKVLLNDINLLDDGMKIKMIKLIDDNDAGDSICLI